MSRAWLELEAKCDGREPPPQATLFTVAGTWAQPHEGFPADLARAAGDERFRWQPVPYPASFGPVAGSGPSYADSVQGGRGNLVRAIRETPGWFVLSGYSQGGEVVGWVCRDLLVGDLQHRRNDCLGSITFGDPALNKHDVVFGTGQGYGISRLVVPMGLRRISYAESGDFYCRNSDTQSGDNNHAMYKALTQLGSRPEEVLQAIVRGDNALLEQLQELLANPLGGILGIISSLIALTKLNAHNSYGQWIPHAVGQLNALW